VFDDSNWESINIPHTWNDKDVLDDVPGYYRGIGWYRKRFFIQNSYVNKQVFLNFEGVNQEAFVFVNGNLAGLHLGGYTAFTTDITPFLKFGEPNLIAVKVDNKFNPSIPPLSADFTFYGGIYRDVNLIITEKLHFDLSNHGSKGVFVNTSNVSNNSATIIVKTKIINNVVSKQEFIFINKLIDKYGTELLTKSKIIALKPGDSIAITSNKMEFKNPILWSPDNPTLYTVKSQLISLKTKCIIDEVLSSVGFRWFSFDGNNGFSLNGKPMKLMGANRHQDYFAKGNALTDEIHIRDMQLLKEMGANFVRLAHYPHNQVIYDACDKLGLIAWAEIPIVNGITISQNFTDVCKNMQTELIRQQFNHPSILMWGYMNEVLANMYSVDNLKRSTTERDYMMTKTAHLAKTIDSLTRAEDPSRVTVMAIDKRTEYAEFGIDTISQVLGFNLYQGWYYDEIEDFGKYLDEYHRTLSDKPFLISEYGAGSSQPLHTYKPIIYDHSMEGQEQFIESYYRQIMERPYLSGAAQWNFVDFVAEMRGDYTPHYNNKGILTSTREKKSIYWFYQAHLSNLPVVKFAINGWTNRVSLAKSEKNNYSIEQIKDYSKADSLSLFDNGKAVQTKAPVNCTAVFELGMNNGTHQLIAKGQKNSWKNESIDVIDIHMTVLNSKFDANFKTISINLGSNCWFIDPESKNVWMPDQVYQSGSFGWIQSDPLKAYRSVITHHIQGSNKDAIFQTRQNNITGYKFDVPNGKYELELLYIYPQTNTEFDIFVNGTLAHNFGKSSEITMACTKKITVVSENGKGVNIKFIPRSGETFLNGIRLTKLY
jgi:beta-galactosidase